MERVKGVHTLTKRAQQPTTSLKSSQIIRIIVQKATMKILGICGSLRKESWNLKLLKNMLEITATKGVDTTIHDLNTVPMFHPDVEAQGIPAEAEAFRDAVRGADAVIIACPEYNGSMTATLKNAIEWLSRRGNLITGKIFFIIGTGPGRSGCPRMHMHASYSIESEGGHVLHQPRVLLPHVANFMDQAGNITDPEVTTLLDQAAETLVDYTERLTDAD